MTPIELMQTSRLTPAAAACRARANVPSTFTARNAASGSAAVSRITCARAAQCTTQSTSARAACQSVDADTLRAWCKERLAGYKVPKSFSVRDELPLLPIGKVDKQALRRSHR